MPGVQALTQISPSKSPNPSMQRCSITVFSRMGLGADVGEEEEGVGGGSGGRWEDGGMG